MPGRLKGGCSQDWLPHRGFRIECKIHSSRRFAPTHPGLLTVWKDFHKKSCLHTYGTVKVPMSAGEKFEQLVSIMARLRAPGGCPWDREQTFDTIKPFLLEETYEVMGAIDAADWPELAEELGDLLLQVVFFSEMAAEAGHFTIEDPIDAINAKLIRRHPHVFADETAHTEGDVRKRWSEIKAEEKKEKGIAPAGLLDSIPRVLPALVEAQQISARAAGAGFDWPNIGEVLAKLDEERTEFEAVMAEGPHERIEDELGDLLFVIVNLARFVKVDPEQALRRTNAKFRKRFAHVEQGLADRGKQFAGTSIEEMEELWQEAKRK
jgi:MazG family protein